MKLLLKISGIFLFIIILVLGVLGFFLNSMIKSKIETMGPKITGTPISLQEADLSLLFGRSQLEGLIVGNPKGFHADHALKLGLIRVKTDLSSIVSDTLVVEEILIESPDIIFEGNLTSNNIQQIQKNVETFSASGSPSPKRKDEDSASKRKVHIHHLTIENAKVTLRMNFLKGEGLFIELPDIHLKDIGKKSSGATWQEIIAQVLDKLEATILRNVVPNMGRNLKRGINEIGESLKKIGPKTEESVSGVLKGLKGMLEKEDGK